LIRNLYILSEIWTDLTQRCVGHTRLTLGLGWEKRKALSTSPICEIFLLRWDSIDSVIEDALWGLLKTIRKRADSGALIDWRIRPAGLTR
jgi:hypothetical protein